MTGLFQINGFQIVLHHVRNVYPVEKTTTGYEWGFKFSDGFFESFTYKRKNDAELQRAEFLKALRHYWEASVTK